MKQMEKVVLKILNLEMKILLATWLPSSGEIPIQPI